MTSTCVGQILRSKREIVDEERDGEVWSSSSTLSYSQKLEHESRMEREEEKWECSKLTFQGFWKHIHEKLSIDGKYHMVELPDEPSLRSSIGQRQEVVVHSQIHLLIDWLLHDLLGKQVNKEMVTWLRRIVRWRRESWCQRKWTESFKTKTCIR